jgi:transposase
MPAKRGAHASATCYSLVETAKANSLEPSAYLQHVLERIAEADTLKKLGTAAVDNGLLEKVSQVDCKRR